MTVGQISLSIVRWMLFCTHTHTNTLTQTNIKHLGSNELWLWAMVMAHKNKYFIYFSYYSRSVLAMHFRAHGFSNDSSKRLEQKLMCLSMMQISSIFSPFQWLIPLERTDSLFFHKIVIISTRRKLQFSHFFIKSLNLWDLDDSYVGMNWNKNKITIRPISEMKLCGIVCTMNVPSP